MKVKVEDARISVIVPVYNVSSWLDRCIASIVNQTYKNLEIILVDDGSNDGSHRICDDWKSKDSRIIVIHKTNGGLSSARNTGLDTASGDFIGFVDGDDYIDSNMYEHLLGAITESEAQVAICDICRANDDGKVFKTFSPFVNSVESPPQMHKKALSEDSHWRYVSFCNRLYKSCLFKNLRFPHGKIYEDEFLVHKLYERCSRVALVSEVLYYYVRRDNSILTKKLTIKRLDIVEALIERYEFFKSRGYTALERLTLRRCCSYLCYILQHVDAKENIKEYRHWVIIVSLECLKHADFTCLKVLVWFILSLCALRHGESDI